MSAGQKKVIDDHCTTEWAEKVASPVGRLRIRRPRQDRGRAGPRGLQAHARQLEAWHKAVEPIEAEWAESVKKVGYDPKAVMDSLKANLVKYKAGL